MHARYYYFIIVILLYIFNLYIIYTIIFYNPPCMIIFTTAEKNPPCHTRAHPCTRTPGILKDFLSSFSVAFDIHFS